MNLRECYFNAVVNEDYSLAREIEDHVEMTKIDYHNLCLEYALLAEEFAKLNTGKKELFKDFASRFRKIGETL